MPKQTKVCEANESLATKDKKTTKAPDSPEIHKATCTSKMGWVKGERWVGGGTTCLIIISPANCRRSW